MKAWKSGTCGDLLVPSGIGWEWERAFSFILFLPFYLIVITRAL